MSDAGVMVDPEMLRSEVREKYREVAEKPDGDYHFHTGRRLAARCGYDTAMVDALPDVANATHYGEIVHDKSVKRRLIVAAQKILTTCSMDHGEARDAVESAQRDVYHIAEDTLAGGLLHIRGLAETELKNIEESRSSGSATC